MLKYALLLYCACTGACFESSSSHQREPFWIAVDVHRVEYRRECFSLCKDPRLEVAFTNTETAQTTSKAWTMREAMNGDEGDFQLMTYWTQGGPTNVSLRGAVVGTDVQLKFQRMCDVDPDRSSFQFFVENAILSDLNRGTYEFSTSCLNVTLQVQLFTERCPWCPEEVRQEAHQEAQISDIDFAKLEHYGLIALAVLCAVLLVAVTTLVCAYTRRKHNPWAHRGRASCADLPDIICSDGVCPTNQNRRPQVRLPLSPPTPPSYYLPTKIPTVSFYPETTTVYFPTTDTPEEHYCQIPDEPVTRHDRQSFRSSLEMFVSHSSPNSSLNSSLSGYDSGHSLSPDGTFDSP